MTKWVLGALAILFLASGLYQAAHDAPTVDEGVDLSSGLTALVRHDLRMVPEHPMLPKVVGAVPALLANPIVPATKAYRQGDWFGYSDDFIRANERAGRLRRILFLARLIPLLEGLGCAALIYVLGRKLFGPAAGFGAAAVWLTTPVIVGLSHFLMMDVPFTLATLAVSLALLRFLEHRDLRRVAWLALILGLSLATRHTALVLLAIAVVTVVVILRRADRKVLLQAVLVLLLVPFLTLWVTYRAVAPGGSSASVSRTFDGYISAAGNKSKVAKLVTAIPAPQEWRAGFSYLVLTSDNRPASLFGQSWDGSRWWYFPGSVVVKLPLVALLFLLVGPLWLRWTDPERRRQALIVLVAPAVGLFLFLLAQPLNLGLRLALPSVALWLVLASAIAPSLVRAMASPRPAVDPLVDPTGETDESSGPKLTSNRGSGSLDRLRRPVAFASVGLLAVTQLAAMGVATPHSLAWTPPPFTPAYRWASDSNVDFGQDLFRLDDWSKGRAPWVAFATTRGLTIPAGARRLVSPDGKTSVDPRQVTGWVAVGVTPLTELWRKQLAWLRNYCPVGTIGGSVLLYRFATPPVRAPSGDRPAAPCFGAPFSRRVQ